MTYTFYCVLSGTIITDCVNMAPEAGKVTLKDSQHVILLESCFPKLPTWSILFGSIETECRTIKCSLFVPLDDPFKVLCRTL